MKSYLPDLTYRDTIPSAFDPGLDVKWTTNPMGFSYGPGIFGPEVETRSLKDISGSLMNPDCNGPDIVYSIAMDVGKVAHRKLLESIHLLYGIVTYAAGKLGSEPIRSQGHIHKVSPYSGWSTPEVYEIWSGKAIIYMQEYADDDPGRCFAVYAGPGDVVVVPPYWVHATISADPDKPLTFGAWCDREYGFEYEGVRKHKGIAWYPLYNELNEIQWQPNPCYRKSELVCKSPSDYKELGIKKDQSIYRAFEENPDTFIFVPSPQVKEEYWQQFVP